MWAGCSHWPGATRKGSGWEGWLFISGSEKLCRGALKRAAAGWENKGREELGTTQTRESILVKGLVEAPWPQVVAILVEARGCVRRE